MKFIVDNLPSYCGECVFCGNKYYDVCSISECQCELEKRKDCPYLLALEEIHRSLEAEEHQMPQEKQRVQILM